MKKKKNDNDRSDGSGAGMAGRRFLQWNLERHRFRYRQTGSKREITSIAWKKMKL